MLPVAAFMLQQQSWSYDQDPMTHKAKMFKLFGLKALQTPDL